MSLAASVLRTAMKCFYCEQEARAACQFCGRFICREHTSTAVFFAGFGQKAKNSLLDSGTDTGVVVENAAWCGSCSVKYRRTY